MVTLTEDDLAQAERAARRFSGAYFGTAGTLAAWVIRLLGRVRELEGTTPPRRSGPMRLIGITGRAGSGKNTVAGLVPGAEVIGLADPIYQGLATMLGLDELELRDRGRKEAPIEWLGRSPRTLLQTLGTEWGRDTVRSDIWLLMAERRIRELDRAGAAAVVVADVRFANEAEMIRRMGGQIWEVRRPGQAIGEAGHSSERGIGAELVDVVIDNDGSLEELEARVAEIF
jgi:hypothetical protein